MYRDIPQMGLLFSYVPLTLKYMLADPDDLIFFSIFYMRQGIA